MLHTCISGSRTWAQPLAPLPGHIGEGMICEPLTPLTAPIVSGSRAHPKMSVVLVPPLRELLKRADVWGSCYIFTVLSFVYNIGNT